MPSVSLLDPDSLKFLASIPKGGRDRIIEKVRSLESFPRIPGLRRLVGSTHWRLRVGDYRVIFRVDDAIHVLRIGHRKDVYR